MGADGSRYTYMDWNLANSVPRLNLYRRSFFLGLLE